MSIKFPSFALNEEVHHPHDFETFGKVRSQDRGSVVIRWDDGSTTSVGAFTLDKCRNEVCTCDEGDPIACPVHSDEALEEYLKGEHVE